MSILKKVNRKEVLYTVPSSFLSLRLALRLMLLAVAIGVVGFMIIEGYGFVDAFYMSIITISTVGFTEVVPLTQAGKLFASFYIILNVGFFAYVLAVFSYYIVQGEIFKKMHLNLIDKNIDNLNNHVILCGFGRYGREAAAHFKLHRMPFVVIEIDPNRIKEMQEHPDKILYLEDDATHDEALLKAGIENARAIITALPDDSDNVFTVLSARQLNSKINIISRARDPRSEKKLELAGADHVIMPDHIGGFYMATLVTKPGAVDFFSYITNEYQSDIGFEELAYDKLPDSFKDKSIRELGLRQSSGVNVIGFRASDGHYVVNPEPDTKLTASTSLIVLGSQKQLDQLRNLIR